MPQQERPQVKIIAEVKLWAPDGTRLTQNSWEKQLELAGLTGDIVSIHTHPIWKGSFGDVAEARRLLGPDKEILAKGFHGSDDEVDRALEAGADYVLVVGFIPTVYLRRCFLEPLTLEELQTNPEGSWGVWNSRNLASLQNIPGVTGIPDYLLERWKKMDADGTSSKKKETFKEARAVFKGKLCQASNLTTKNDIEPDADAVLVGSKLEIFAASLGITA